MLVAFRGMCAQCKVSEYTMKDVVEAKLREFVAEDLYVEEADESAQGTRPAMNNEDDLFRQQCDDPGGG